jgi:hypothetical protein
MNETVKASTTELKEKVRKAASGAKEPVSVVLQVLVLSLCAGFLVLMLGVFFLVAAII